MTTMDLASVLCLSFLRFDADFPIYDGVSDRCLTLKNSMKKGKAKK